MIPFHQICKYFSNLGFSLTIITNFFLIFITIFKIKTVFGAYKKMIVVFALYGIILSSWKVIAQPVGHNYNRAFIMFSLNMWIQEYPLIISQIFVGIYASFYNVIMAFLAVQFAYRLLTLVDLNTAKKFDGVGILGWIGYPLVTGFVYGWVLYQFTLPDAYSDAYLKNELLEVYDMEIEKTARFIVIPYASDNSLRWNSLAFIFGEGFLLGFQYFIIIYCGIRMHFVMKKELKKMSAVHQKLHRQFFKALIVQTLVPTILFVLPAFPVIISPLLDLKFSAQTGLVISLIGLYPSIDSVAFMMIVTEYQKAIRAIRGTWTAASNQVSCVTV